MSSAPRGTVVNGELRESGVGSSLALLVQEQPCKSLPITKQPSQASEGATLVQNHLLDGQIVIAD